MAWTSASLPHDFAPHSTTAWNVVSSSGDGGAFGLRIKDAVPYQQQAHKTTANTQQILSHFQEKFDQESFLAILGIGSNLTDGEPERVAGRWKEPLVVGVALIKRQNQPPPKKGGPMGLEVVLLALAVPPAVLAVIQIVALCKRH